MIAALPGGGNVCGIVRIVRLRPFGGRINKAWGLALRKRFCRSFNFELQAAATDNGLNIALAEQHSFPLADVFQFLQAETVQPILEQASLASPIFGTRWRWDASRALALLRFQNGKKVPPQIQRIRSDDLLASVFPDVAACQENIEGDIQIPDHPLVHEVMKDVLTEAMDIEGLQRLLRGIADGTIRCIAVDTPVPSQFSHEILNANPYAYLDDAPLEERRARAVENAPRAAGVGPGRSGRLEPAAIAQVREEAWPDVRDADELHDVLHTLMALPEDCTGPAVEHEANALVTASASATQPWKQFFERLIAEGRAGVATVPGTGQRFWVATEKAQSFRILFPSAEFRPALPDIGGASSSSDDALLTLVTGWVSHWGRPVHRICGGSAAIRPESEIEKALLRMEASGSVLRGKFTDPKVAETEWCDRRLLARIHRLTVATLRKQIEPVTAAQFTALAVPLATHQLARRSAENGVRWKCCGNCRASSSRRCLGATDPGAADRRLRSQVARPVMSDGGCRMGRLSPHPATLEDSAEGKRRVIPTSVAPITFFIREEADWMTQKHPGADQPEARGLSHGAKQVLEFLRQRGASFFADIVRGTDKLKAEVETALWELVAGGLVTADGFDNLRSLIDPKRRSGQGSGRSSRPRHSTGRWALLYTDQATDKNRAHEAVRRMLLRRYGIVFRDVLARETLSGHPARTADGVPAAGGSGRDSWRALCGWLSGGAVRFAGGGGIGACDEETAALGRDYHDLGGRPAEPGGNPRTGRTRALDFRKDRQLQGWGSGTGPGAEFRRG